MTFKNMPESKSMKWTKSPQNLIDFFNSIPLIGADIERKKMFGYPVLFVSGQLFAGLHCDKMMLRLGESDRDAIIGLGGGEFEPMPGRKMKEYVTLPVNLLNLEEIRTWIERSLDYARALPPKTKKRR